MTKKQMAEKRKAKYMDYKANVEPKKPWPYSFSYVIQNVHLFPQFASMLGPWPKS